MSGSRHRRRPLRLCMPSIWGLSCGSMAERYCQLCVLCGRGIMLSLVWEHDFGLVYPPNAILLLDFFRNQPMLFTSLLSDITHAWVLTLLGNNLMAWVIRTSGCFRCPVLCQCEVGPRAELGLPASAAMMHVRLLRGLSGTTTTSTTTSSSSPLS